MAARGYEFYLRVLNPYPQAAMKCSVYYIDTDEIPT